MQACLLERCHGRKNLRAKNLRKKTGLNIPCVWKMEARKKKKNNTHTKKTSAPDLRKTPAPNAI